MLKSIEFDHLNNVMTQAWWWLSAFFYTSVRNTESQLLNV